MKAQYLILFLIASLLFSLNEAYSQDYFESSRKDWLKKAEANKPQLVEHIQTAVQVVKLVEDSNTFQGWKTVRLNGMADLYSTSFKEKKEVVVDFGEHLTGHFSFHIKALSGTPDAPLRLKFTFAEVPAELAVAFDPYPGSLSRAWLQDEIVTVTQVPGTITIPRRLAFRYLKIELLASSPSYDFCIDDMNCTATTSATKIAQPLPQLIDPEIIAIDHIGLNTLKECMQTVYEDGPKRDQRIWIGDFYLGSLANNYSYKNFDLTKRCLYLLAALSDENGLLHSNVFETPEPHAQTGSHVADYAILFNSALMEYAKATGDLATAADLWPVAKRQIEIAKGYLNEASLFDPLLTKDLNLFFDWKQGLDKQASMQGMMIFSINQMLELAKLLDKTEEVKEYAELAQKMKKVARKLLFDKTTGIILSGPEKQISLSSQIWMVLGGVLLKEEARFVLSKVAVIENSLKPISPYLYHFYVEALIKCGLPKEAKKVLVTYWGGMVKKGADTYWEVYAPTNDQLSPYNFLPLNNYCHAWSCTPVYFIRKYPEIFK